jgi:hypothetical protein
LDPVRTRSTVAYRLVPAAEHERSLKLRMGFAVVPRTVR